MSKWKAARVPPWSQTAVPVLAGVLFDLGLREACIHPRCTLPHLLLMRWPVISSRQDLNRSLSQPYWVTLALLELSWHMLHAYLALCSAAWHPEAAGPSSLRSCPCHCSGHQNACVWLAAPFLPRDCMFSLPKETTAA